MAGQETTRDLATVEEVEDLLAPLALSAEARHSLAVSIHRVADGDRARVGVVICALGPGRQGDRSSGEGQAAIPPWRLLRAVSEGSW